MLEFQQFNMVWDKKMTEYERHAEELVDINGHVALIEQVRGVDRALAPTDYAIGVKAAPQPLLSAWRGGSLFAASESFAAQTVTREQYREGGHSLCRRKFLGDTEGGVTL